MTALLYVIFAAALAGEQQSAPLPAIRIEAPGGGGNAIVMSVTGHEQEPQPLTAAWKADDKCLNDVACFVSSWIEANSTGNMEHLLALRAPEERTDLQNRFRDPQVMQRNVSRFNDIKRWSLLGWVEYGAYRVVLLARDEGRPTPAIYTLPLKRLETRLAQTDGLAADEGIYQILDRVGTAIIQRHQKK